MAMSGQDLEAIVTLLEVAAITLTPCPSARFSYAQLIAEARRIGGEEIVLDERDVRIVLPRMKSIRRDGAMYFLA